MNQNISKFPSAGASDARGEMALSARNSRDDDGDTLDLIEVWRTIWRGKWLILALAMLGVVAGWLYATQVATPLYRSTAVVLLDPQEEIVAGLEAVASGMSSDTVTVGSEAHVITSRVLLGKVVDTLDLTQDPEFNRGLLTPGFLTRVKASIKSTLGMGKAAPVELRPGTDPVRTGAVSALLSKVTVTTVPLTRVFRITVESEDAGKSSLIADTVASLYIRDQLDAKFEATEQATAWLTNRVTELRAELETTEASMKAFSAKTDLVSPEALAALERQLKDLRERAGMAQTTVETSAAKLADLEAATTPEAKLEASNDAQLRALGAKLNPSDAASVLAFERRFAQVLSRAKLEVTRAENQKIALENSQKELQRQFDQQSQDLIELQQLTREVDATRLLYEYFLGRLKETSVQQGIQKADSRILSHAVTPVEPSSPRSTLLEAFGGIFGGLLALGILLLKEMSGSTFRTSSQLEKATGLTVMGQIPLMPQRQRRKVLQYLAEKPTSAASEAIRNLRTSILLSNLDHEPQVIMLTSSVPSEGKTTLTLSLAQNFSAMDKKVLVIEGDIRRRVFRQYMQVENPKGLLSVLSGESRVEDTAVADALIKADVLIGEHTSASATDIFASDKFATFLAEMRKKYDVILIDTPPVLVVPDARVIAHHADALLFVVHWDRTPADQVEAALQMFESVKRPVNGVVLSQIDQRGMKRYGYGGKYGAYAAYGSKYYTD